jgi:hypothetical protein
MSINRLGQPYLTAKRRRFRPNAPLPLFSGASGWPAYRAAVTHGARRDKRRTRRRAALVRVLLVPAAAAVVVAYLARSHPGPTSTDVAPANSAPDFEPGYGPDTSADSGPELDAFTIEQFVEPAS